MEKKDIFNQLPTAYDHFYSGKWIAESLCDLHSVKKFFEMNKFNFKEVYYGYLYLLELVIIDIVRCLENFIEDINLSELIHWGGVTTKDKELRELIKEYPEIEFIYLLLNIRKQLSSLRFKEKYNENEIIAQLDSLKNLLKDLDEFLVKKYEVSRIIVEKEKETALI